jgi:hypothetical protein
MRDTVVRYVITLRHLRILLACSIEAKLAKWDRLCKRKQSERKGRERESVCVCVCGWYLVRQVPATRLNKCAIMNTGKRKSRECEIGGNSLT